MKIDRHPTTAVDVAEVVITSQLSLRLTRQHDLVLENSAFRELANAFATEPNGFLDKLVNLTLKLCDAGTVGVSVEQTDGDGEKIFRWVAMAGQLEHLLGGTTPRNFSPCGVCVDQNAPLLMSELDRAYPYFKQAPLPFVEALLLPWGISGGPVGTLWVVAHDQERKFDREDARLMACLAAFAAGAIQLQDAIAEKLAGVAAARIVSEMAHRINNPLQGALLALSTALHKGEIKPDTRQLICIAESELQRVRTLSAELLLKASAGHLLAS